MCMKRKSFYKTTAWVKLSKYIRIKYYYICQSCGRRGVYVHHIIPLTNENINDPTVTLNEENLTLLCLECHNEIHNKSLEIRKGLMFDDNGDVIEKI